MFSFAQFNPGAKEIALSNSGVALSNDVFAIFNNPSGISQINWREIGVYYSPSPFGLNELANAFVAFNQPFDFGNIAIGYMNYGFDLYKENKITFAYSNKIQSRFFYGGSITYNNISIENYGSDNSLSLNLGALAYINKNLRTGFSIININRASYGDEKDQIPVIYNFGFSYDVLLNLILNIAVQKELDYDPSFRFGIDYALIDFLSIRTGFSTEPDNYSAGLGINYSLFQLDYGMVYHNELGFTHQFSLIIQFSKNKKSSELIKNNPEIK